MTKATRAIVLTAYGVFAIGMIAAAIAIVIAGGGTPQVTRDDVLTHWAKLPLALPATPAQVDENADKVCAQIRKDNSAAKIIKNAEGLDKANGGGDLFREQMRLMVAYRCPEYASLFRK